MSIVHLLPTYTHDYLQQLSLKLSATKLDSSHASYDELDCCWKIRNPNHQPKIMTWKPGLLFLMQVHSNKPNGLFYESCSNVTARNIWDWKYSKVTTAEAFRSQSYCNSQLEWFSITCSQTLEAVITNWYNFSNVKPDCSVWQQSLSLTLRHSIFKPAQILLFHQNTKCENMQINNTISSQPSALARKASV